jgi:pimeloyl-ACP methyl ester carboxylesterase
VMEAEFPGFSAQDWDRYVRLTWRDSEDGIVSRCDPAISYNLREIDAAKPAPPLWPLFEGLKNAPLLVFRGEHSDLLSREAVAEMKARYPAMQAIEVPGVGHPPVFWDERTIGPVREFVARCDA